ncbi:prenylated Rab acceptor-like protein [Dinothrombium tinctorium]|uniref:PRA1 family protein n=1 Tax=Dinothrombium tinctorium TaxID=1965070 RepID=A0A3S3QVI3_9ACAR|nr:prenylated Rab acceptor-like protein [Dinothrombium tinctorium]RWS14654.1 prenylated Rab acceptor-like protein [Dinothrombium tinctorium]
MGSSNLSSPTSPSTHISFPEPLDGELDGELNKLANNTFSKMSLKNMSLKQLYRNQWQNMRSWGSFLDTNRMKTPTTTKQWSRRLLRNLEFFQSNYLCVFLILVIYCILTSPMLLLAIGASLGACYIITLKNAESPVKLFGYKLSVGQQYLAVAIASFPLFYLAGAGSAVFWVLGASFFVIGLHASIYAIEMNDPSVEEIPFQPFVPVSSSHSV